jgi:hypothetical protein
MFPDWNDRTSLYYSKAPGIFACAYATPPNFISGWSMNIPLIQVGNVSPSLRNDSIKRVEELAHLQDDWDGYGAFAPSVFVCKYADWLIKKIAEDFQSLPSPEITASPSGTVLFTWEKGSVEVALEIGDQNFSGYIERSGVLAPIVGKANNLGINELSAIAGSLT